MIRALLAAAALASAAPAESPVHTLAGRYSERFKNSTVDGDKFWSENVVEIVPVDASHAYFRISLQFFNAHMCSLYGVARAEGPALTYLAPDPGDGGARCRMTLSKTGGRLRVNDHGGTCNETCGARGSYDGDGLPWASKRPIRDPARLKSSDEYASAIAEWRTGRPTMP